MPWTWTGELALSESHLAHRVRALQVRLIEDPRCQTFPHTSVTSNLAP